MFWIDDCLRGVVAHGGFIIVLVVFNVDCEQSLLFFRFMRGVHTRASFEPHLQSRAWLFACVARFARRTK